MTRRFLPGGSYVDFLPTGEYAALVIGSHVETHLGPLPFPAGESYGVLFLRITNVGGFQIAGQAHDRIVGAQHWMDGAWSTAPGLAPGNSPVIFDLSGRLFINDGSAGSQGYRYCTPDNYVVTGDQSYGPTHGLSEWSAAGDLLIGQGHDSGGVLVWDGHVLRQLEAGDGRFIRVQVQGEAVAVSFVKGDGAVLILTSLAELRALPPVDRVAGPVNNGDARLASATCIRGSLG